MSHAFAPLPAVVRSVAHLRATLARWRQEGDTIALIPTMGYLHDGHLALVTRGRALAHRTVASVFVNPTQFGPADDLDRYPRDETGDREKLASAGCDLLFAPDAAEMYPPRFSTSITVSGVSESMCGIFRPQMFGGVAVVVTKLLLQALPDVALFGEKDYQQLLIIRRMVRDLDIPVRIEGVPTIREPDGLAMSSRNSYLTPDERKRAPILQQVLSRTAHIISNHGSNTTSALTEARAAILAAGFSRIDYLDLRCAETLVPMEHVDRPGRLLTAAWLGKARLIDNVPVWPDSHVLDS